MSNKPKLTPAAIQALDVPPTLLRPPQSGVELISRPHVFRAITELPSAAMAKLVAPAGSGKTTILGQAYEHLRREGVGVAWLSVTSLANDFHRFVLQLIASVRTVQPGFAASLPSLLEGSSPSRYQEVAMRLAVAFAHGLDERRLMVFVDDYHCVNQPTIHETLGLLLDHLPPEVHLVLGARTEPDLPVARLRASARIVELGWDELRFSRDEAEQLFALRGCALSATELQRVYEATEGWATGLQLASLNLDGDRDHGAPREHSLTRQIHVTEYWLDAVLSRLTPRLQQFLLDTAVLDSLSAGLCNAVCGIKDGGEILSELERLNLFTFRLDDEELWFRYHHLFREFLLTRLRQAYPERVDVLYASASRWFEDHGDLGEAVAYALRGNDVERACRLLVPYGRSLFRAGRFKELRISLEQPPESAVIQSAELCILKGWSFGYGGEFERARAWVEAGRAAAVHAADRAAFEGELAVLDGTLGVIQNDEPNRRGLHPQIMEQLEGTDSSVQAFAHIALGYAFRADGRLSEACHQVEEAISCAERNDCSLINMLARYNHAALALLRGERGVAESSARGSLQIASTRHWNASMGAAFVRAQLGAILFSSNRLDASLAELDEAVDTLRATEAYGFLGVALVMRARTLWAKGRLHSANVDLTDAETIGESRQVERVRFQKALLETRMALAADETARACKSLQRAKAFVLPPTGDSTWSEHVEQLKLVEIRLALSEGEAQYAAVLAETTARSAVNAGRLVHWLEARVLAAEAALAQGEHDDGEAALREALAFAAEEDLWRPFFFVGPNLRVRIGAMARAGVTAAARLDQHLTVPEPKAAKQLGEPLHAREIQILALVAEGVTNREIGQRLFISAETVKWYLKGLYRKLDVANRTAAVARARELGLLKG